MISFIRQWIASWHFDPDQRAVKTWCLRNHIQCIYICLNIWKQPAWGLRRICWGKEQCHWIFILFFSWHSINSVNRYVDITFFIFPSSPPIKLGPVFDCLFVQSYNVYVNIDLRLSVVYIDTRMYNVLIFRLLRSWSDFARWNQMVSVLGRRQLSFRSLFFFNLFRKEQYQTIKRCSLHQVLILAFVCKV